MQIRIYHPIALHEKGRRSKNEDNIYPTAGTATVDNKVFLVCDGVGGAARGELASQIVAENFGQAFETKIATSQNLAEVLNQVQQSIDAHLLEHPQSRGMGTTATFLQMTKEGMVIAHAGDSRVYHIRKGSIVFCTYDHSLKNELLKQGRREEAKYAKDNIITRAIQGNSVKQIQLDVSTIKDIQAGDYFLLCSDGVWGAIPDKDLRGILNQAISDEEKMETIRRACELSSNDNYSAYLIRVKEVVEEKTLALDKTWIGNSKTVTTNDKQKNILVEDTKSTPKSKSGVVWGLLGIFLLVLGGWFLYINMGVDGEGLSSTNTIENTSKQQLMDQQANRKTKALPANQPVSNNKSNSSKTVVKKKKKSTSGNNRKDRKILIPPLPTLILTPISIESSEFREWNKK